MYRFECEKENWQASWTRTANHFYGKSFAPTTLHLAYCKKRISEIFRVELDDVIVYQNDSAIL
jgi:hypothetical protein